MWLPEVATRALTKSGVVNSKRSILPPSVATDMPKAPSRFTSFPRRRFALYIPFDDDYARPYEITFPISDSIPHSTSQDYTVARKDRTPSTGEETPSTSRPLPGVNPESDGESDDERPYENLLDKSLHGKGINFYYYLFNSPKVITGPPPRPPHVSIRVGTIFVHRNPTTSVIRSWRLETSVGGEEEWVSLQDLEKRLFALGAYYYTVSEKGTPSWVTRETLRKRKYYNNKSQASRQRRARTEGTPTDDQQSPQPQDTGPTPSSSSNANTS